MGTNGRWHRRLRYWLNSPQRAKQLREEMEIHLQMRTQELLDGGMPEEAARGAARREFGNPTLKQEESRSTWIARWLSDLLQDAAYAARTIRRQPAFTAVAVLSAALGIGACSLIFGLANYALFHPLPVSEPSRLASLSGRDMAHGKIGISLSYPDITDFKQARSFEAVTGFYQFMPGTIATGGDPQRYWGSLVMANYFDVVRPTFAIGRGFDAGKDDRAGETPVAVLSYSLWQSRFQGDRGIAGRSINLNGRTVVVTGVTGPGFRGTEAMFYSDFWVPLSMASSLAEAGMGGDRFQNRGSQWMLAAGRLRDGASLDDAAAEAEVIGTRLSAAYPATNKDRGFHVERAGQVNAGFRKMIVVFFSMLLGVAVLVLCTACANVANLLLARASARQKEIATRLAIGAGRGRLIRQLLTESVMLALLGGAGGYAIAQLGANAVSKSKIPLAMPVDFTMSLDYRVMLFAIVLSALTGVVFGLVPAVRATRPDLVGALKDDSSLFGASWRFGLRNLLVVGQVSICMVLLVCSGLFVRSLYSAGTIDPGFSHRNLLMLAFDPSLNRYSESEKRRLADRMLESIGSLPGVESVALGSSVPLAMEGTQNGFSTDDPAAGKSTQPLFADIYTVSPRYFETFGIRVIEGDDFAPGVPAEDIVIVNQALADKAFPRQNPIGRRIRYLGRTVRITGLVATTKSRSIGEDPHSVLYFPLAREVRGNDSLTGITLIARTRGNPGGYVPQVRQSIRDTDPTLAVFDIRTMETHLSQALFLPRAAAILFGFAGVMGLVIATLGLYGVISFMVARQTKEFGIRMALGATRSQVLSAVLRQGLALTVTGCAVGLGLALALSRVAASLLYGVSSTDRLTFITVPALLLFVATVACLAPARRAASLDPLRALRYE